jgi:glycosyltransferase involved in cell wall biosynthesis
MSGRPRVLVVAYACEPWRGSESGAGWGVVMALRSFAECSVLVSPVHMPRIAEWQAGDTGPAVEFVDVPERWVASLLKRRGKVGEFLAYLLWLRRAKRVARRLVGSGRVDVAMHATYSAFWLPTPAVDLGVPSVWGPVGGGVTTPTRLWRVLGWRGVVGEVVDLMAVRLASLLPATRRTWRRATVRVLQNRETLARLPRRLREGAELLNHTLFHEVDVGAVDEVRPAEEPYVLWAGPIESRKGPRLAVRALAATGSEARMIVVGDGPERPRMEALAERLGVAHRIRFDGWVDRGRVLGLMRGARVVVFTGMREEGGLALGEALLLGCPSVVLANGGAELLASSVTDATRVSLVVPRGLRATVRAMAAAIDDHWLRPREQREPLLDKVAAISSLERIVRRARR